MDQRTPTAAEATRTAVKHAPLSIPPGSGAEMGTIADTRARFGIPRSTQYRLAAAGHIRMIKLGRTTLVDFASVRAFLASGRAALPRSPERSNPARLRAGGAAGRATRWLDTPRVAQPARFRQRRRRASLIGGDMHPHDEPHPPRVLVILLPDAPDAGGEPRAAVLRPGLPPLAFASVREAVAKANTRAARR